MKDIVKTLLLILVPLHFSCVTSASAPVGGGGSDAGNGGNIVAFEFFESAQRVLQTFHQTLKTYPELKGKNLQSTLERAQILVSSVPIHTQQNGTNQECSAINFPESMTIIVHEQRWKQIDRPILREALALHELLGLLKVEGTGNYKISKVYLELNGITCAKGLCEDETAKSSKPLETFCRIDNKWHPSFTTLKYRFQCADQKTNFLVWCDLTQDPLEFGTNKIDVLGGLWKKKTAKGGDLEYSDFDRGSVYCTYLDED